MAYQQLGQLLSFTELECSQHPDTGSRPEPHKSNHTFQRPCHGSGSHWPIHIGIVGEKLALGQFLLRVFHFTLSVTFHQRSILIHSPITSTV